MVFVCLGVNRFVCVTSPLYYGKKDSQECFLLCLQFIVFPQRLCQQNLNSPLFQIFYLFVILLIFYRDNRMNFFGIKFTE